jgi:hypothetical protein
MSVFCQYMVDMMEGAKLELGIEAVYYGDQDKLPFTPAVCVEPTVKDRSLQRAPRGTTVNLTAYILVYHGAIIDTMTQRKANDEMAEAIEERIHEKNEFDGLMISTLVDRIESGYSFKGSLQRSSRLTVTGMMQEQLPRFI